MKAIRFDSVTKTFPDGTVAVQRLKFEIEAGETVVLIGPSGCGKTTTLRLVAGLEAPTKGSIWLGQSNLAQVAPDDRMVAMMFQSDALYPHMSVRGNLSFGLKTRTGFWAKIFGSTRRASKDPKSESQSKGANSPSASVEQQINRVAQRLGIERLLDRKPHQLSGGERQRVALGRALVREPAVFLLDEPLSRLDARLAGELRTELRQVFRELGIPVLYVTHNQREALALADRIAVMDRGEILQIGKPSEIYRRPVDLFVANFVGELPINLLPLVSRSSVSEQSFGGQILQHSDVPASAETLGVRPEDLSVKQHQESSDLNACDSITLRATVRDAEWLGDRVWVNLEAGELGDDDWTACCEANVNFQSGEQVEVGFKLADAMFFDSAYQRIEASR